MGRLPVGMQGVRPLRPRVYRSSAEQRASCTPMDDHDGAHRTTLPRPSPPPEDPPLSLSRSQSASEQHAAKHAAGVTFLELS